MAVEVRPFASLGKASFGWLEASHHFSFGHYHDPARMGVGPLRVWNDDLIQPRTGFDPHPHRDMEIITYVRRGAITHEDSMGNKGRTAAGDVQVMSAGRGVRHAEYNREAEPTLIFQTWLEPSRRGLEPRWGKRAFPEAASANKLVTLASGRPADENALAIFQDAAILGATIEAGHVVMHELEPGRQAYLVAATGSCLVNGARAAARDGVVVRDAPSIILEALDTTEILLADLPGEPT